MGCKTQPTNQGWLIDRLLYKHICTWHVHELICKQTIWFRYLTSLKFGSLPQIINKLRGIPVLKSYANLHLHELDNLSDIYDFKSL